MANRDDEPRSLRDPAVRQRRREMLSLPHIRPLNRFVIDLRKRYLKERVPDFDPLDGGMNARILFLFEKPGPMTDTSGFISRNNDDRTAEYTCQFMNDAGIPRRSTLLWNLIPWWDGQIRFCERDSAIGLQELEKLIDLLAQLKTIVLVGRTAGSAECRLQEFSPKLNLIKSPHPSPIVRATNRALWDSIPHIWHTAMSPSQKR